MRNIITFVTMVAVIMTTAVLVGCSKQNSNTNAVVFGTQEYWNTYVFCIDVDGAAPEDVARALNNQKDWDHYVSTIDTLSGKASDNLQRLAAWVSNRASNCFERGQVTLGLNDLEHTLKYFECALEKAQTEAERSDIRGYLSLVKNLME